MVWPMNGLVCSWVCLLATTQYWLTGNWVKGCMLVCHALLSLPSSNTPPAQGWDGKGRTLQDIHPHYQIKRVAAQLSMVEPVDDVTWLLTPQRMGLDGLPLAGEACRSGGDGVVDTGGILQGRCRREAGGQALAG